MGEGAGSPVLGSVLLSFHNFLRSRLEERRQNIMC